MIINIDKALELRTDYNVLKEPLHAMMQSKQEAWEKENPIDMIYNRSTISGFQETYTSSIGFAHAFAETSDFAVGPIFNTAEGFSATYRTRTFQGGFIITQQALEDRQLGKIKDDANAFVKRWHADVVDYAMKSLEGGFGVETTWGTPKNGGISRIKLTSADTVTGELDGVKNPLFTSEHTIVKRDDMSAADIQNAYQSNCFHLEIDTTKDSATVVASLADGITQIITEMENYTDDNGKIAGVTGAKTIVAANNAYLKGIINTALATDAFAKNEVNYINQAKDIATAKYTPYLNAIEPTKDGKGFFIVDKSYNADNHGPEFTERIAFTLDVNNLTRPNGVSYDGRQRFDINSASWRGIAYVYVGTTAPSTGVFANAKFKKIVPKTNLAKPVSIVGKVTTEQE